VWSKWINAHGAESIQDGALQGPKRATVAIRYRSDVTATWSVVKDGERYAIIAPPDHVQERHTWLELQVQLMKASS
jgi:SPP1 family predicted phage head-tail adaptor